MDLQKLRNLCVEARENRKCFEDLDISVKEEENNIKKQKSALEKRLLEVKKLEKEQSDKLWTKHRIIWDELTPVLNEANKYGCYNIHELGKILEDLATKITGEKHVFKIRGKDEYVCIENHSIYYSAQEAYLENIDTEDSENRYFVFAESELPEAGSIPWGLSCNGVIHDVKETYFSDFDLVMCYGFDDQFYFKIHYSDDLKEKKIYPFIYDFLNYVSLYRLNNDLSIIEKKSLKSFEEKFLMEAKDKYKDYKKREGLILTKN